MNPTSRLIAGLLVFLATFARAAGDHDVSSPLGTFMIEQRSRTEGADGPFWWQTWIVPAKGAPYALKTWHEGEINWPGTFHISPGEDYILHIQKTGSGDSYGVVFERQKDGTYRLLQAPGTASLSEQALAFFARSEGMKNALYHSGVEFLAWAPNGKTVEISLHGSDVDERYFITDWRFSYTPATGRLFFTREQFTHNRTAITRKPAKE